VPPRLSIKELKRLDNERRQVLLEKKAKFSFLEIILFIIFLMFVSVVAYQNTNSYAFGYTTMISNYFQLKNVGSDPNNPFTFNSVISLNINDFSIENLLHKQNIFFL
jgi:hypothetical protein